ncbi:hypothetical protein [Pseudonocardia sp.]|uniref:hypothetical protein n=1 Tax=Pseudonocardia sp. TaxID=60912 RepID=UPI0031FC75C7
MVGDESLVPEHRGRCDEQGDPAVVGESADESGDERAVAPGHPGAWSLVVEYGELVAQYEDLDVLGRVEAGEQRQPAHEVGDHEVGHCRAAAHHAERSRSRPPPFDATAERDARLC